MAKEITFAAVEDLANLVTASALDHERLNGQTKLIADLTQKVETLSGKLVNNATEIATLKVKLAMKHDNKTGNWDRGRFERKQNLNDAGVVIKCDGWFGRDVGSYCWSHGYNVSKDHTILACNNPTEGHVRSATREDNKGESPFGKPT